MKPASIIALVISLLLMVGGYITCSAAEKRALKNGESLFSVIRNEDSVQKVDLTETTITKMILSAEDVTINIIGNSDSSYIEFINFPENYYSLSIQNRVLSFDEIPDMLSMLKFWENGFTFKGIRHFGGFFKSDENADKEKKIDIYLSSDKEIKNFDISAATCRVSIKNMVTATDYIITAESVTVSTDSLSTNSAFHINNGKDIAPAANAVLKLGNTTVNNMTINAEQLKITSENFRANGQVNVTCNDGSIEFSSTVPVSRINFNIRSAGNLLIDSVPTKSPFITSIPAEEAIGMYNINAHRAEVLIDSPDEDH